MNDLKPRGYIVPISGEDVFRSSYKDALHERLEYESTLDSEDQDYIFPEPVYAIPSTHRVVSVELLEEIAFDTRKKDTFLTVRNIIDNEEST